MENVSTQELNTIIKTRLSYRSAKVGEATPLTRDEATEVAVSLASTRARMGEQFQALQILGRRETIGCVALEITQRCNLDCSLCYLSDHSESVKDLPLEVILGRLDEIKRTFGPGTAVQITGGDPTLRQRDELVAIVRRTRELGLQPALFTNGILASRSLLEELSSVGLMDIAFHVDMTQERKGYASEVELNAIRQEYIERARGLPLTVIFNTTAFTDNFHELPDIVEFFRKNSDIVRMCSFQLQADTGRGELTKRAQVISIETIRDQIERGAGTALNWDPVMIGHPHCHSFVPTLSINGNLHSIIDDNPIVALALEDFKHVFYDRRYGVLRNTVPFLKVAIRKPIWFWWFAAYLAPRVWKARKDLIASRGKIGRLSFFIHNFMDADGLIQERIDACSFMVMSPDGPISMCAHNARRDEYILKPLEIETAEGKVVWNPLSSKPVKIRKARGQRKDSISSPAVAGQ